MLPPDGFPITIASIRREEEYNKKLKDAAAEFRRKKEAERQWRRESGRSEPGLVEKVISFFTGR